MTETKEAGFNPAFMDSSDVIPDSVGRTALGNLLLSAHGHQGGNLLQTRNLDHGGAEVSLGAERFLAFGVDS